MTKRDLHQKPFDESTKDKLELYREYLREWLPVFIHHPYIESIQVFDFFAGPGIDIIGNHGSPLITCEEIHDALRSSKKQHAKIKVFFNELNPVKFNKLSAYIEEQKQSLPQVDFVTRNDDFSSSFEKWCPLMLGRTANLLFLDQNGVDQIAKSVFQRIVQLPTTDFIFFISSAIVNRFKKHNNIRYCVPIDDQDLSDMTGTNVHRILAKAYRRWVLNGLEYYLGSFSIKKGANVYGLVFGSKHPRGIDKFLQVAWRRGGDANFDIDKDGIDPAQPALFPEYDKPSKIKYFEEELERELFALRLKTNIDVYLFALQNGMLAIHARDALKLLVRNAKLPKQKFAISYDAWKKSNAKEIKHFN
jgi:three-Cys-motif partner protein